MYLMAECFNSWAYIQGKLLPMFNMRYVKGTSKKCCSQKKLTETQYTALEQCIHTPRYIHTMALYTEDKISELQQCAMTWRYLNGIK